MDQSLGKDIPKGIARRQFLQDNCDRAETKSYYKKFSTEKLQEFKKKLSDYSVKISDIQADAKASAQAYKDQLKPLLQEQAEIINNIKQKSEYVSETVFRFTDQKEGLTAFYNEDGDLIECRPMLPEERQANMFAVEEYKKTGTN